MQTCVLTESLDKYTPNSGRASGIFVRRCLWTVFKLALGDEDEGELGVPFENAHWEKLMCRAQVGTSVPSVIIRGRKPEEINSCLELQSCAAWLLCCSPEGCGPKGATLTVFWKMTCSLYARGNCVPSDSYKKDSH